MISYDIYKILHVFSVVFFISVLGIQIFLAEKNKKLSIFSGILSLFVLVGGMGLLARLGVSHQGGWPMWATIKLVIWFLIAAGFPIILKRSPKLKPYLWYPLVGLVFIAIYLAVIKPF
jgi:uncharacterized membrane protein SirB2